MNTMEVALALSKRYQKARDLMLQGRLGKARLEDDGRTLTVPREGVEAYRKAQEARAARVKFE